jgi:tRNA U38,U39,U40 pseudouridine synthase TruA
MPVGIKPPRQVRGEALAAARAEIFAEESRSVLVEVEGVPTPPAQLASAFNRVLPDDLRFVSVELAARNFDPLGECRWKRLSARVSVALPSRCLSPRAHVPSRCLSRAHTCPLPACLSRTCVCAQERELSPALQPHCRYCYTFDAAASAALRKSLYWSTLQDRAEAAAADSAARGGTEDAEGGRDTPAEQEGSAGSGSGVGGERAAEAREGGGNSGGGGSWAAGGGRGGGGNDGDSEKVRRLVPEPDDGRVPLLDVARMQAAAALLEGTHDFAAFQAKGGRVTTVRTIFKCAVEQDGASDRVR